MGGPLCTPASVVVRRGPQREEKGGEPGWVGRRPRRGSRVERQETSGEEGTGEAIVTDGRSRRQVKDWEQVSGSDRGAVTVAGRSVVEQEWEQM